MGERSMNSRFQPVQNVPWGRGAVARFGHVTAFGQLVGGSRQAAAATAGQRMSGHTARACGPGIWKVDVLKCIFEDAEFP